MGYANCGKDSKERPIGYAVPATCDHEGCEKKIDRGLAYACGGEHGIYSTGGEECCEGYFCSEHLIYSDYHEAFVCLKCYEEAEGAN